MARRQKHRCTPVVMLAAAAAAGSFTAGVFSASFVSTRSRVEVPSARASHVHDRRVVAMNAVKRIIRKKAKLADITDDDIQSFYEDAADAPGLVLQAGRPVRAVGSMPYGARETISGVGGNPIGIERDLITKFFGDGDHFGSGDHAAAFETLKEQMRNGEPIVGEDDGKGWIWLVADNDRVESLSLELRKSTPVGLRPLVVAKQDDVDGMFDKLNWKVARRPLHFVPPFSCPESSADTWHTASGNGSRLRHCRFTDRSLHLVSLHRPVMHC
ncbi:unnamed protein product [Prorocentrum cordatum]|uniref:Uncharacterized protein n=1 Tax=Prorocentrum cordatum TaxID=2364126 RepID=A0ABN9VXR0_9DINO|nr:unnamed protein product [Polarella glacialis]